MLPLYANAHSESALTGRQTTALREEARQPIKEAVSAGDEHTLVFCGSGATAATCKTVQLLDLANQDTVVFDGPYEHHSNDLPWRESAASVVRIPLTCDGSTDQHALYAARLRHGETPLKIGAFSAASKVTGGRSSIDEPSALLHAHGAIAPGATPPQHPAR